LLLTAALLCAVLRRRCCSAPARQQSTDMTCQPGTQQQTRRTLLQRSIAGTDRRTDAIPLHRPYRILCEQCQKVAQSNLGTDRIAEERRIIHGGDAGEFNFNVTSASQTHKQKWSSLCCVLCPMIFNGPTPIANYCFL